jgi:hypothetical protein
MAKAVNLSHLIHDWTQTRPKLKGLVHIVDLGETEPGEIKMRLYGADVYDPYIWIANIYPTEVVFRSDYAKAFMPIGADYTIRAEDPQFFKRLETYLLRYSIRL